MNKEELILRLVGPIPQDPGAIYAACKQIDGRVEAEGTFPIIAQRVQSFYAYREPQLFYQPVGTYDELLEVTMLNHKLRNCHVPEQYHYMLSVGFSVFKSAYTAPLGRLPLPKVSDRSRGEHFVALTGGWNENGEELQFANSWGESWGDHGHGWLSRQYLEQHMTEAWLFRNNRVGPTMDTHEELVAASNNKQFAKIWMRKNRIWQVPWKHASSEHQLVLYETLSTLGEPVEVIEIRNGLGLRVGWAHLHHISNTQPRTSVLKELFVWPTFRRQGYAKKLESIAKYRARVWHRKRMQILFHEADAVPAGRMAGEMFAKKAGYTLTWKQQNRPSIQAVGEKML